jgi:hypothetical protein
MFGNNILKKAISKKLLRIVKAVRKLMLLVYMLINFSKKNNIKKLQISIQKAQKHLKMLP